MASVEEVRDKLKQRALDGEKHLICPVCERLIQKYKRSINATMARQLIKLYKLDLIEHRYYHVSEINGSGLSTSGGDFCKLKVWGLVEEKPKDTHGAEAEKKTSGHWRITPDGIGFVEKRRRVPKYIICLLGDNELYEDGPTITIEDALGEYFSYRELMRR